MIIYVNMCNTNLEEKLYIKSLLKFRPGTVLLDVYR